MSKLIQITPYSEYLISQRACPSFHLAYRRPQLDINASNAPAAIDAALEGLRFSLSKP
jgi:hypothetical protein